MRPEQFGREARRWVTDRDNDGGRSEHARQRARRSVRVWDGDDGMVHLHGEFDTVTGKQIANRLRAEAGRMYDADKKTAGKQSGRRRSFHQCMADALDNLTATASGGNGGKAFADICVVAHLDADTGKLVAETPEGDRLPEPVLELLACNSKLTGLLYDRDGKPIWRAHSVRTATEAQRQILLARYGGCFHCAAHPALCQIHHIKPVSKGGATKISNMVPVCWDCHQKIHHHNWQIRTRGGQHTLHPPDWAHYGPAHAPEHPPPLHAAQLSSMAGFQTRAAPAASTSPPCGPGPAATARAALRNAKAKRDANGTRASRAGPAPPHPTGERPPRAPSPALFPTG